MGKHLLELVEIGGLSIIPVNKDKTAAVKSWKPYQERRASAQEVEAWAKAHKAFAVVAGVISGGVECLDIDLKNDSTGKLYDELCSLVIDSNPHLYARLVICRTPSGGYHWLYKADYRDGNQKLARDEKTGKCTIETRGNGGYFLIAPSPGYQVLQGELKAIPKITVTERDELLGLARSLGGATKELAVDKFEVRFKSNGKKSLSAGDDFSNRGDIVGLLCRHGWKIAFERGGVTYLTRPGKEKGVSATFNHDGRRKFRVFSTSAEPFKHEWGYNGFAVLALLEYNGDFRAAAAVLREAGYGEQSKAKPKEEKVEGKQSQGEIIAAWLSERYLFRTNVITGQYQYSSEATLGDWAELRDYELNTIHLEMEASGLKVSAEKLRRVIQSAFTPQFDPFADYISSLPGYDGTDYIRELSETLVVEPSESEAVYIYLKKFLTAHLAQIVHGGANHVAIILKGAQGVGKTTWLNRLCPEPLRLNYLFVGDIEASSKDSQLLVAEKWIINLDELESMQRQEIGHLKSLFTMDKITVRRPYAKSAETLRRKASFVGSVNRDTFLTDDTGNRRFLVVDLLDVDARHNISIDACYSQAADLLANKFTYWFEREEIGRINALNEAYRARSLAEELVSAYCRRPDVTPHLAHLFLHTTTQIIEQLQTVSNIKLPLNDYFIRQLGSALRKANYERVYANRSYSWLVEVTKRESYAEGAREEGDPF